MTFTTTYLALANRLQNSIFFISRHYLLLLQSEKNKTQNYCFY